MPTTRPVWDRALSSYILVFDDDWTVRVPGSAGSESPFFWSKKRKKVGKGGSIQKQPGELIGGVNCYPLTRRRGKNHGNNLSTKTSDEKPVHF